MVVSTNQKQDNMLNDTAETAQKTANAVKTVARTAAKAAAGNYVGAAKEILLNPKAIISVIVIIVLFGMMLFYAAPLAIFETINSAAEAIENSWDEVKADFYSGGGGALNRTGLAIEGIFTRTLSNATNALKNLWSNITNKQTENDSEKDRDSLTDADMKVIGDEDSAIEVFQRKIDAVKDKLSARADNINQSIEASCTGDISNTGTINGWVYNNLFAARDASLYTTYSQDWWLNDSNYSPGVELKDNVVEVVYGGMAPVISVPAIKTRNAVDIIGLYSAMHNTSSDNIKVYELMKWMGYKSGWDSDYFIVGDAVSISVSTWKGTFMPMYLETEKAALLHNNSMIKMFGQGVNGQTAIADTSVFDDYQTAAADLLVTISSTSLYSLTPVVTLEQFEHYEKIADAYTSSALHSNTVTTYKEYHYTDFEVKYENNELVKGKRGIDYKVILDDKHRECRKPLNDNACKEWIKFMNSKKEPITTTTYSTTTVTHPAEYGYVIRNRAIVSYPFHASIGIRNFSAISKLAGFKNKPIDYSNRIIGDEEEQGEAA